MKANKEVIQGIILTRLGKVRKGTEAKRECRKFIG
jgi:hypothetical protein